MDPFCVGASQSAHLVTPDDEDRSKGCIKKKPKYKQVFVKLYDNVSSRSKNRVAPATEPAVKPNGKRKTKPILKSIFKPIVKHTVKPSVKSTVKPTTLMQDSRAEFINIKQKNEESVTAWYTRLQNLAPHCSFQDADAQLRLQFVHGLCSSFIHKKLLPMYLTASMSDIYKAALELEEYENAQEERLEYLLHKQKRLEAMKAYFDAIQLVNEDVLSWYCRLRKLACEGGVTNPNKNDVFKDIFANGLMDHTMKIRVRKIAEKYPMFITVAVAGNIELESCKKSLLVIMNHNYACYLCMTDDHSWVTCPNNEVMNLILKRTPSCKQSASKFRNDCLQLFNDSKQIRYETAGNFYSRLHCLITVCRYSKDKTEDAMRKQFIEGLQPGLIREFLKDSKEELSLQNLYTRVTFMEEILYGRYEIFMIFEAFKIFSVFFGFHDRFMEFLLVMVQNAMVENFKILLLRLLKYFMDTY